MRRSEGHHGAGLLRIEYQAAISSLNPLTALIGIIALAIEIHQKACEVTGADSRLKQ